nr:MaoC family dehydratase N-terminal domain-containing protein [Angustibacter aerolatus]
MVNAEFAGRVYPPMAPYEVGREKIREFAEAVGPQPAHVDPEAARALGHPDVIAPPTFAVIVAQRCDAQPGPGPRGGHRLQPRRARRADLPPPPADRRRRPSRRHPARRRGALGRRPLDGHHPQRDRRRGRPAGLHRDLHDRRPRR